MTATEAARSGDAGMRAKVCEALASLRFSGRTPVSESVIQEVKSFMQEWLQTTRLSLEQSVLPLLPDPAAREQVTGDFRSRLGWLDGLETRKLEMAFLKAHLDTSLVLPLERELPIKKKKKRKLDSSEGAKEVNHCWDLCLLKQIQARIEHDSEFCHELLKSSERWSARAEDVGSLQVSLDKLQGDDASAALADFDVENEMHDVEDGLLFRRHPRLGREGAVNVRDEHGKEHRVVKLCFIAYLDGIETANPLGVARGSHSMECIYVALLNLPLTMRYRMENLFPVTLCNTSTLKRFGTRAVIGGRGGGDDELDHPRSLGAVMRKLDAGISLKFPSAEAERGYEYRWCCGWQLLFLADFPAAGKVLPTAESVSATMPCRGCTWRWSWTQWSHSLVARSRTTRLRTAPPSCPASGGSSAGSCVAWSTSSGRVRRPGSADRSDSRRTH